MEFVKDIVGNKVHVEDAAKDSIEIKNPKNLNNIIAKTFKQEYFRRVA